MEKDNFIQLCIANDLREQDLTKINKCLRSFEEEPIITQPSIRSKIDISEEEVLKIRSGQYEGEEILNDIIETIKSFEKPTKKRCC